MRTALPIWSPQHTASSIPGCSNADTLGQHQATSTIQLETRTRRKPRPDDAHDCTCNKNSREISVLGMNNPGKDRYMFDFEIERIPQANASFRQNFNNKNTQTKKGKSFTCMGMGKGIGFSVILPPIRHLSRFVFRNWQTGHYRYF